MTGNSAWILSVKGRKSPRALAIQALALFFLFLAISVILSGCATGSKIRDVTLSYNAVKTVVIANLPQGVRRESQNGREMTSNYFEVESFRAEKPDADERAYALVKILGASRPYDLDVIVYREKKKNGVWRADGIDKSMNQDLVERLKQALADRREDRNVIDDFRAF